MLPSSERDGSAVVVPSPPPGEGIPAESTLTIAVEFGIPAHSGRRKKTSPPETTRLRPFTRGAASTGISSLGTLTGRRSETEGVSQLRDDGVLDQHASPLHTGLTGRDEAGVATHELDEADALLQVLVAEVNNTFGDRHSYVVPVGRGGLDHDFAKQLHVSPFNGMDQSYRFSLTEPGARLAVSIEQSEGHEKVLRAGMALSRLPLTDQNLLRLFATHPLVTAKVISVSR